jgi:hypothetical protein
MAAIFERMVNSDAPGLGWKYFKEKALWKDLPKGFLP